MLLVKSNLTPFWNRNAEDPGHHWTVDRLQLWNALIGEMRLSVKRFLIFDIMSCHVCAIPLRWMPSLGLRLTPCS